MAEFFNRQWRLPNNENKNKQSNYSINFDASSNSYINLGSSSILAPDVGSFTFSAWINPTTWGSGYHFIWGTPINGGMLIGKLSNGNFGLRASSVGNFIETATLPALSTWTYICITRDSSNTLTLFYNGVQETVDSNMTQNFSSGTTYIGSESVSHFNGKIDAVAIFNYALSSSQITTLYGSSSTGIGNPMSLSPNPVAYYPLGDQDAFNGADYLVPNASLQDFVFDFDGSTSYITTSVNPSNYSALTASAWINFDSTTGRQSVFSQYQDNTNNVSSMWMLWNVVSNELWFFIIDSSNAFKTAKWTSSNSFTLTTGNWYNVVGIWDGSYVKIYVNGEVGSYSDAATSLNSSSLDFLIGSGMTSGGGIPYDEFNGKMSNAQIFNTALPATGSNSIETLYNNGSPLTSMSGFTSLQGWWKLNATATFDGTNWSIPDDSSNSNTGTSSGMTQANLVQSDLSFTSGYSPYALDFDGTSNYIDCGTDSSLGFTSSFTLSAWINNWTNDGNCVAMKTNGHNYGYALLAPHQSDLNKFKVWINTSTGWYSATNNIGFSDNTKWVNLIICYDSVNNTLVLYSNGIASSVTTTSGTLSTGAVSFKIGVENITTSYYNGSISNVSTWNAALTSSQITEIYNEGVPSNLNNHSAYSNLVSWWQLGSNSSFNSNSWTCLDEKGTNDGVSSTNMSEVDIVNGVGYSSNGVSSGMSDNVVGDAPYSIANSLSVNMDVLDRTTDIPS